MSLENLDIEQTWTLFLDRDGVINRRIAGGYVTRWEEFEFLPGVLEALNKMAVYFRYIFMVTNQQGIGKGVMSERMLKDVHQKMLEQISKHGGRIDYIYHCPALEAQQSPNRKPAPGMAHQAKQDFPEIRFDKSLMVGDSPGDIEFGRRAGMYTTLCAPQTIEKEKFPYQPHFVVNDLLSFALLIEKSH